MTHKDVERYFMTIPEAVQLVIHAAAARAAVREQADLGIHVLDMGRPVRVYDLAERMIALSGKSPGRDIGIEIIGLRPGEKLTEELIDETEHVVSEGNGIILVADRNPGKSLSESDLHSLIAAAEAGDREATARGVYELIEKVRLPEPVSGPSG